MARKGEDLKSLLNKYFSEFLSFLVASLESETDGLLKKFRDWINFKKRFRRYVVFLIVAVASSVIILYGAGEILGSFFPGWRPGLSHIFIGMIAFLIGWGYRKYD